MDHRLHGDTFKAFSTNISSRTEEEDGEDEDVAVMKINQAMENPLLPKMVLNNEMNCRALDEERFCRCCRLILQRSDQLRDGWSWEALQGSEGYLRKTTLRPLPAGWGPKQDGGESPGAEPAALQPDPLVSTGSEEEDADLRLPSNSSSPVLQWEYHILYSCSYATPVLYFRAFTLDGRSLTLEEIWKSIHSNFGLRLQNCPRNAVSQQEHPLLGQPFFFLHPCRTEEFMGPVLQAALDHGRPVNYVLSWLSVVGPMVGLEVPLEYSTEPTQTDGPAAPQPLPLRPSRSTCPTLD